MTSCLLGPDRQFRLNQEGAPCSSGWEEMRIIAGTTLYL